MICFHSNSNVECVCVSIRRAAKIEFFLSCIFFVVFVTLLIESHKSTFSMLSVLFLFIYFSFGQSANQLALAMAAC